MRETSERGGKTAPKYRKLSQGEESRRRARAGGLAQRGREARSGPSWRPGCTPGDTGHPWTNGHLWLRSATGLPHPPTGAGSDWGQLAVGGIAAHRPTPPHPRRPTAGEWPGWQGLGPWRVGGVLNKGFRTMMKREYTPVQQDGHMKGASHIN